MKNLLQQLATSQMQEISVFASCFAVHPSGPFRAVGVYPYLSASTLLDLQNHDHKPWLNKTKLVGGCIPSPLKNMTSSIGMMRFPLYFWENMPNSWQPVPTNQKIHQCVVRKFHSYPHFRVSHGYSHEITTFAPHEIAESPLKW